MVSVTHAKVVSTPDDGTSDVGSDEWNANHVVTGVRELLAADRTYYVRSNGSDSNTGLANTAGGAKLTFAGAYSDICSLIDFGGHTVTISMENITWSVGCLLTKSWIGGGALIIDVNGGTISISADYCIGNTVPMPGTVTFQNVTFVNTSGNFLYHVNIQAIGNFIQGASVVYGASDGGQIGVFASAVLTLSANYSITGGAFRHYDIEFPGATCIADNLTVTVSGTPAFSDNFAYAAETAYLQSQGTTFSGSATGSRYTAEINGVIYTNAGGANYFPGNVAGTTATGGQYI